MKKILPIIILEVLVLSGLGASALSHTSIQPVAVTMDQQLVSNSSPRDYTHTVLVEVGTATWCPSCPQSNAAWHSIYGEGTYDFEYTELVDDKSPAAHSRFYEFNPAWVPTSYWDGGMFVYPGTNIATFKANLDSAGARVVPDLISQLSATWLGDAKIQVSYSVNNNDNADYAGSLHVYILELVSTLWNDYSGNPYNHALLDFAVDEQINIPAGDTLSDTVIWDGAATGYPSITEDNIQVILAVFDDEAHTGYSDPPTGSPFNAYYSDEVTAVLIGGTQNNPPTAPTIQGPTSGVPGVSYTYTFSSVDPEQDQIFYCINWSDGSGETCSGPFPSGEEQTTSHTWTEPGIYMITVKAHDTNDAESEPSTLIMTITEAAPLEISIAEGFGIKVTITNNGLINLTNVNWSITLDGGLILLGKSTTGTIPVLEKGGEQIVKPSLIFGFGKTTILVTGTCDEGFAAEATATGFVFGPFILGVK